MKIDSFFTSRNLTISMLGIGLVQIVAYYLAGMLASPDTFIAVPQPDTLLYCQAARRIAEGHPFSFAAGTAVSTGTTSILYPFFLALLYLLGATGSALLTAGFWLNAVFYLIFLLGWAKAISIWIKEPCARGLAALLVACSGQLAFCAAAQSDIGCWMAASGLFAAGLAMQNRWLYGTMLILGPWIRPEGMICIAAFGAILVFEAVLRRCRSVQCRATCPKPDWLLAIAAVASAIGVFALNIALTGQPQFSSVANKGYFSSHPFSEAVCLSVGDLMSIFKCYLFGLVPTTSVRDLFVIPFLSAVFLWTGVFLHPWRNLNTRNFTVLLLAAFGGILTVAQSGWQATNFDRYLAWCIPLFLLFIAEGAVAVGQIKKMTLPFLPPVVCILFALGTAATAVCSFHKSSAAMDVYRQFAREMNEKLPPNAAIGSFGACGIAYFLEERPYKHLSGIYSPEFTAKDNLSALEILKKNPDTRFDFWFLTADMSASMFGQHVRTCCGENVLTGPDGFEVRRADWSAFDHAAHHHASIPGNRQLVCQVDVGDETSERNAHYEAIDRYGRRPEDPFLIVADLDAKTAIDIARPLVGGDAFTVPLTPGKDACVVLRIYHAWTGRKSGNATSYTFGNPLKFNVAVNEKVVQLTQLDYSTNGFSDVSFEIPGHFIKNSPCRLALLGDHIACGYWIYQ